MLKVRGPRIRRLEHSWDYNGVILGLYWDYNGVILGLYWDYIGIRMGLSWHSIGIIMFAKDWELRLQDFVLLRQSQ